MKVTLLMLLGCLAAGTAAAEPLPADTGSDVRLGSHPGYGRVVFTIPNLTGFSIEKVGDKAIVHFPGIGSVPGTDRGTHNITAVRGGDAMAVIEMTPGVRLHSMRLGNRIVIDVLDAARTASPTAKDTLGSTVTNALAPAAKPDVAKPLPAPSGPPPPVNTEIVQAPIAPKPQTSAPVVAAGEPGPSHPPVVPVPAGSAGAAEIVTAKASDTTPLALAASRVDLPPGVSGSAALLPFGPQTGAAAFRRGGVAWIVFDERRPIDLSALHDDPLFGSATVQLLTSAALVRLPLPDGVALRLTRQDDGWTVAASSAAAPLTPIIPAAQDGHLLLPTPSSGNAVVVPDPETGQNLLVGTLRSAQGGLPVAYRLPELVLEPSWLGVLVEPLSDEVSLHAAPTGFVLETGGALPAPYPSTQALNLAASLTRRFDFPTDTPAALMRRLQVEVAQAGDAPPLGRSQPRLAAAQTLIALGMGAEAQSLLRLTQEEDPRLVAEPEVQGLSAIAALLSGRDAEAGALDDPALSGTDEVALWRAVRAASRPEGGPEAAPVLAAELPLVMAYPAPLQGRLLPLAVETMARYGAPAAADAVLASRPDDPRLTFARALRLAATGQTVAALVAYDALAEGRDRLSSTRAAKQAVLLRLSTGAITPAIAAAALERQFLAWRGDNRELELRLQVAELRAQSGAWRPAFDLLRETVGLYPEATTRINASSVNLLGNLLAGPAVSQMPAIDFVALAEENAEIVAVAAPAQMAGLLADKLTSLDLPRRAAPILERMMRVAPHGPVQALLGTRVAALRYRMGDDAGAAAALETSNAPDLPQPLREDRGLLRARLLAHGGNSGAAAAELLALGSPAADDLRATLLTDAHEWRSAELATQDLVDKTIPATGVLDSAQQDTLLRLATAQQRAGDTTALLALGKQAAGRISGPRADMFRLLTAVPIDGVTDLHRASSEIALAKSIPSSLAAIGSK